MRHGIWVAVSLSALVLASSCTTTYESKGDKAYKASLKASGDSKRLLEKEAYVFYRKAVKMHPDRIGARLRNRFVEMTLSRANMVLIEGSATMDALPFFIEDIDTVLTADVDPANKTKYAEFLVTLADSNFAIQKLYKGLGFIDKAIKIAPDPASFQKKRDDVVANFAKSNFDMAKAEYDQGKTEQDFQSLVRAEYHTQLALLYNKSYPGAEELLSTLHQLNLANYSAYKAVVEDMPDTTVFRQVNKYDILLAVPTHSSTGATTTLLLNIYNYSYNPLRLRPENFIIVDVNDVKYSALPSTKIDPEILEQEHEAKLHLVFKTGSAKIKKVMYDSGDHHTEKFFL
jgi:hypothetical protein